MIRAGVILMALAGLALLVFASSLQGKAALGAVLAGAALVIFAVFALGTLDGRRR